MIKEIIFHNSRGLTSEQCSSRTVMTNVIVPVNYVRLPRQILRCVLNRHRRRKGFSEAYPEMLVVKGMHFRHLGSGIRLKSLRLNKTERVSRKCKWQAECLWMAKVKNKGIGCHFFSYSKI